METVVAFTNLDDAEGSLACPVYEFDGHRMQLKMTKRIQVGSAVKVESDYTLSLGEVSCCRREGDNYIVYVEVMQALHKVSEMARLARALLG